MERKFKVGDKVRVKSLEELRRMGDTDTGFYTKDDVWFNPRMKIYAGFECVVTKHSHIDDKPTYKLSVDAEGWEWSDDMLEDKHIKENIITKITSAIIEAAKEATIIIEQTEDGGIKISPIEEKEKDLAVDTPCMVGNESKEFWSLRYYAYNGKVFMNGLKSKDEEKVMKYDYIIPFDRFNPNNIEESLKYNIVK